MLAKLLIFLVVLYGTLVGGLYFQQKKLVYLGDPERVDPKTILPSVEEVTIERPGGVQVLGWYQAARAGKPTLLYFHGNGGNVSYRSNRFQIAGQAGFGLLMMSYRGYGGSGGEPGEADNTADAQAFYDWLRSRDVAASDIVVLGESLGSGVAVPIAASNDVRAVILQTPFTSLVDVAAGHYPWAPVRLALTERYNSLKRIAKIDAPLLIVHGTADRVVPYASGRGLFDAAVDPKEFVSIEGAGHNNLEEFGVFQKMLSFAEKSVR